jgi:hypothetical protein
MANNMIQVKRTTVSGRTPNTTNSSNAQYIAPGEFALNMADNILFTSNGTGLVAVGATQNAIAACTATFTGSTTSAVSINSTAVAAGNSTVNAVVSTTLIAVSNATSNSNISPQTIFVGNSTVNTIIDTSGGVQTFSISSAVFYPNTNCVISTTTNHGVSYTTGLAITTSGSSIPYLNTDNYSQPFQIKTGGVGTNSFSLNLDPSQFANGGRIISSVVRSSGVVTVTTKAPHQLTYYDTVILSGVNIAKFPILGTITLNVFNSTQFSFSNGPNKVVSLTGVAYSVNTLAKTTKGDIFMTFTVTNTYTAGEVITFSGITNTSFPTGPYSTLSINGGNYTITSASGSSFTVKINTKIAGATATGGTGTITGALASGVVNYDENATLTAGAAFVIQSISANTLGGSATLTTSIPSGFTISNSSFQVKATPNFLYIGSNTAGYIFTPTGGKATTGIP